MRSLDLVARISGELRPGATSGHDPEAEVALKFYREVAGISPELVREMALDFVADHVARDGEFKRRALERLGLSPGPPGHNTPPNGSLNRSGFSGELVT